MANPGEDVYCTLVMNDGYLPGAAVLAHSLRDGGTTKRLAAMVTMETLSADAITELQNLYDIIIPVPRIVNPNPANVYLMGRGDLLYTFTKINLWRQTQFRKIVYIDADVVALRAPDELFTIQAPFAAAPDIGWPDAFNSGLMVLTPNMGDFWALQTLAATGDSFDGADQGLLNQYYEHRGWHRLSFTYNCTPNAEYQWEPAYRHYKSNIKMVHFIGKDKPWTKGRQEKGKHGGIYGDLVSRWWAVYDRHLKNPAFEYTPGKPYVQKSMIVQKMVFGESYDQYYGAAPEERIAPPAITDVAPSLVPPPLQPAPQVEIPVTAVEESLTEPTFEAEEIEQGKTDPTPTVEQRRFSAPHSDWDATRSAPPSQSKPEAANFPNAQYGFSDSHNLFQPPPSYPAAPKDMYYQVPEYREEENKPKPIFPWEREPDRPKPSRKFAEDMPPEPSRTAESKQPPALTMPPSIAVGDEVFTPFSPQANAWDENPSIERYVRAVLESQMPKRMRALQQPQEIMSPTGHRESLKLTDFPTADDRPSLPVTPAPIRRPNFWGEERDEAGELPAAEGVPDQAEWNPTEKLEELRRSSVLEVEHLNSADSKGRRLSNRDMPSHAAPLPHHKASSPTGKQHHTPPATTTEQTPYYSGTSTPHGESLQTVPEEPSSTESSRLLSGDGSSDVVSPRSQHAVPSVATLEAGLYGRATMGGKPMFSEPSFGPEEVEGLDEVEPPAPEMLRRSPGSFSAQTQSDVVSPTER